MVETLPQAEVREIVGADLIAQEGRQLLVLLDEPMLPIGAEGVMSVFELLEGGVELTLEFLRQPGLPNIADILWAVIRRTQLPTALEDRVDLEVAF
jgi:hypothetical protein